MQAGSNPLTQQLQIAEHAWRTLLAPLAPWSAAGAASAAASSASATAVPALPPAATLRSAYASLRSLQLDTQLHAHLRDELLRPWLTSVLREHWWPHAEQLHALQQHYFGAASSPTRAHPSVDAWLLHTFPARVDRFYGLLQPLLQRLQQVDAALATGGASSLHVTARRELHTLFTASLEEACVGGYAEASSLPLRRRELMQELLFKFYRVGFRVLTCCEKSRRAARGAPAEDDEENDEEDAAELAEDAEEPAMDDASPAAGVIATVAALPRVEYSEPTLAQFASTCTQLLSLRFLGPSEESSDAVPSLLPSSFYMEFFLQRLRNYVQSERVTGVADRRVLAAMERWMEHRVRPMLHVILRGREESAEESARTHSAAAVMSKASAAAAASCPSHASFLACYSRLHLHALELFSAARASEFFDLVKQHPDSVPALQDLAAVLPITRGHAAVVSSLSRAFRARVLLPGTETRSIVEQYVNSILSLRALDPSGLTNLLHNFLQASEAPQYLRARADTTRTVVRALWGHTDEQRRLALEEEEQAEREMAEEEKKGAEDMDDVAAADAVPEPAALLGGDAEQEADDGLDLSPELEGAEAAKKASLGDDSDAEEEPASADQPAAQAAKVDFVSSDRWQPEPAEAGAGSSGAQLLQADSTAQARYLRSADVLSLLIDLCGRGERNEEVLLLEYKNWLSERFLRKRSTAASLAAKAARARGAPLTAAQLLAKDGLYDTDAEVTHLERMKLRFGDLSPSLQDVEVMLKDITNSKRIMIQAKASAAAPPGGSSAEAANSMLFQALRERQERLRASADEADQALLAAEQASSRHSLAKQMELAEKFSALMLSAEFWPSGTSTFAPDAGPAFKMPAVLRAVGDAFADVFHTLKAPRMLGWSSGAGGPSAGQVVELELALRDGRVLRVECEPIHAAILELFVEEDDDDKKIERTRWSLSDLAEQLEMDDEDELLGPVHFWVHKGLLRVVPPTEAEQEDATGSGPVFELVEHASQSGEDADGDAGGGGSGGASDSLSAKQRREEEALVESYVLGALNNFASMSAPQLHQMLKLFNVPGFLYTHTEQELRALLNGLHASGTLTLSDGLYTRAKNLQAH